MDQCIFCNIISDKVPSKKIYEDDNILVVLDIYPANPAHLLILTKKHHEIFNQLSKEEAEGVGDIARKLTELVYGAIKPDGVAVFMANGASAGQKAPHFITHVIPRFAQDGLSFEIPEKGEKVNDELFESLKKTLQNYFPEQT